MNSSLSREKGWPVLCAVCKGWVLDAEETGTRRPFRCHHQAFALTAEQKMPGCINSGMH